MNKQLLSILLASFSLPAIAQPTLTSAVHQPQPGDTVLRTLMTAGSFVPGPPGPAQTFQYGGVSPSAPPHTGVFTTETGPAPWNYTLRCDFEDGGLGYVEFFHATADSLVFHGLDKYIPDLTPVERHNPSRMFPFPFGYGDSFRDDFSGQHQSVGGLIPFTGTVDVLADAWGDLILGTDTIPNTLRIHTADTTWDDFFGNIVMITQECYTWYAGNLRYPVLSACTDPMNGGAWQIHSSLRAAMTARPEPQPAAPGLGPNPFRDLLTVQTSGAGVLSLWDLQGKLCLRTDCGVGSQTLRLPPLPAGAYLAVFETPSGTHRELLLRE